VTIALKDVEINVLDVLLVVFAGVRIAAKAVVLLVLKMIVVNASVVLSCVLFVSFQELLYSHSVLFVLPLSVVVFVVVVQLPRPSLQKWVWICSTLKLSSPR
jgi:hypothetical protein